MVDSWSWRACRNRFAVALTAVLTVVAAAGLPARAAPGDAAGGDLEIAVALPLSGDGNSFGQPALEGIELAIEDANADRSAPHIAIATYDDKSSRDGVLAAAAQVVASRAALVLGPAFSTDTLAANPVYAAGQLLVLPPTATSDAITGSPTTYRIVFKNSEQGDLLANYVYRVLGLRKAAVIVEDNQYGQTLRSGFEAAADSLGLKVQYYPFQAIDQARQDAATIAADPDLPAVVLLTLDADGAQIVAALRTAGVKGPILGDDAFGAETFGAFFKDQPEEHRQPGYYTEGVYGVSPVIFDSANAETLRFAERFRARFGHDPAWMAAAGFDAARLGAAAARAAFAEAGAHPDGKALRAAVLKYVASLDGPAHAMPGLLGPIWFDRDHGRQTSIRIGRFTATHIESAPVQIVPVAAPDRGSIQSGAVFENRPGRYARLQRVVYTGMFINEIPRLDLPRSTFGADFYLWLRYAKDAGPDSADPANIVFPNLAGSGFDRAQPSEVADMPDGTQYRLWRVQGEFRNDFDLHRFPFDRQDLHLSFFNARADADRIVYVIDRTAPVARLEEPGAADGAGAAVAAERRPASDVTGLASGDAFRNLSQWSPAGVHERRESLVTASALGDPRRVGIAGFRELSGFLVSVTLDRRAVATLAKTLLPLGLMTLIMFASLYFPHALVKEKVTVAITGALSGAVLLSSINGQLGAVGYTMAVEYAFFIFFGLSLLCILSVLTAERLRVAGRGAIAAQVDLWTKVVFLLGVAATAAGAAAVYAAGSA